MAVAELLDTSRAAARDENTDDGWVCIGTSWVELTTDIGYGGGKPHGPMTPEIAAAWSEAW